jgi:hypothetical protein
MRTNRRRGTVLAAVSGIGAVLIVSCSSPQSPDPPGGGQVFELDPIAFEANVAPILSSYGCDNLSCHGGGIRGTFELSPPDAKDLAFDFEQSSQQVWGHDQSNSPLLAKPLADDGGTAPHSYEPFATTEDPAYQTILAWIAAGEYQ